MDTNMRSKWNIDFRLFRWGLHIHILRFTWLDQPNLAKCHCIFLFHIGYGHFYHILARGLFLYFDLLNLNMKEGTKARFGLNIPLKVDK